MLIILKLLAAEELLSPEQFGQLSELEQVDLLTIALVIKDTKVGGLKFLPQKLNDLKQQLHIWWKDLAETGHSAHKQVAAVHGKKENKCNIFSLPRPHVQWIVKASGQFAESLIEISNWLV